VTDPDLRARVRTFMEQIKKDAERRETSRR